MKKQQIINQIIIGSLFGDGCLYRPPNTNQLLYAEVHCIAQKNYILWKNKYLNFHFFKRLSTIAFKKRRYIQFRIQKMDSIFFKPYYKMFYKNRKRIVSYKTLKQLNKIGLSVWICDDGCYSYSQSSLSLHCERYSINGIKKIKKWFDSKFNICTKILYDTNKNRYLYFNKTATIKINKYLIPFVIKNIPFCMHYKFGLDNKKSKQKIFKRKKYEKKWYKANRNRILKQQKKEYKK